MSYHIQETESFDLGLKTFYYIENSVMGSASIEHFHAGIWHFNRLYLHKTLRNRGIGTALIRKVVEFCKNNNITLFTGINPYDGTSYEQLRKFFIKNGFVESPIEDMLVILKKGDTFELLQSVFDSIRNISA